MPGKTTTTVDELREITEALVISSLRAQEKAEEAEQAAKLLRRLVDGLDAIIWEADVNTGQYSFVSRQAEQFLGYPIDHWLAEQDFWAAVIHPLDRMQAMESWRAGIQLGEQFNLDYRALTADKRVVWLRNMVSVKSGPDGQPHTLRGVIIDVTRANNDDAEMASVHWREHRIAEALQRSMLLKLDEDPFPSLEIATFYEPCWDEAQVGGDFFDFFVPSRGKVALVVGDVCGKGLAAAAHTVQVKYALRAYLHDEQPAKAMAHLNRYLAAGMGVGGNDEEFVALCLAVMDQGSGEVTFVAAGAEPPQVLRADGVVLPVEVGGTPLGISPDATYAPSVLQLGRGDTLLMATDGITEARHDNLFLGPEGVAQLAREALPLTLKAMGRTVLDGARSFAQGNFGDDVCMLLARRR